MSRGDYFGEETLFNVPTDLADTGDLEPQTEASLILLNGPNAGARISLDREVLIGRGPDCGLRILESDISRTHARVRPHPHGGFILEDLGSRNGTYVEEDRITAHRLKVGDRIRFGTNTLTLFSHFGDLQDQLLHQQKLEALGQLAGGIAHDFNNLLGAVLSNVTFLLDDWDELEREDVKGALEDISAATNRAAELTRQLLGFARKGKYEHKPTELSDLAREVLTIVERTSDARINVRLDAAGPRWVLGDRSQLHQVLLNLCINARDAMPNGGDLVVRVDDVEDYVIIEVSDTGEGIKPEVREHMFEPFYTTKELGCGTGLGLATAYGIVKNHGGEIQVESTVGKGTVFRVLLVAGESPIVEITQPPPRRSKKRGTVLVVDDEELHRRGCARVLRRAGYEVLMAADGLEALRIFRKQNADIDIVLLDLEMPKMTGDEVAKHMNRMDCDVRILATSGYTDARRANMILDGLACGFLRKPYSLGALEDSLHRVARMAPAISRI